MKKTTEEIEEDLYSALDECLESANADGSIKSCTVDMEKKTVTFVFDLVLNPEGYSFAGY